MAPCTETSSVFSNTTDYSNVNVVDYLGLDERRSPAVEKLIKRDNITLLLINDDKSGGKEPRQC